MPNRCCNLLPKDELRASLGDKLKPNWKQVALVVGSLSLSCGAERLAGRGACPDLDPCGPSGEFEGEFPPGDSGEEVASFIPGKLVSFDFGD